MRHVKAGVAAVAVAVLVGCGHQPAPGAHRPPADGGTYDTPRAVLAQAGDTIPCPDPSDTDGPLGARAQTTCQNGDIVVRVYGAGDDVTAQIDLLRLVGGDLLVGQNWTVNADPATLQAAQVRLGGQLMHVACQPPDCTN